MEAKTTRKNSSSAIDGFDNKAIFRLLSDLRESVVDLLGKDEEFATKTILQGVDFEEESYAHNTTHDSIGSDDFNMVVDVDETLALLLELFLTIKVES